MIQTIYVVNASGDTLDLNLRSSLDTHGLLIFNIQGLGAPKATVEGLRGPMYDGMRSPYVRADPRHILLTLAIPKQGASEESGREKIYKYFNPKSEIQFRVVTDTKDVSTPAFVESIEMNHFATSTNAVISLYCKYPYFYETLSQNKVTAPGYSYATLVHTGDRPVGCKIQLTFGQDVGGPITVVNVTDFGTQTMEIDLTLVPSPTSGGCAVGDRITIDTRPGMRSLYHRRNSDGLITNITGGVSADSDWLQLMPGDNDFAADPDEWGGAAAGNPGTTNLYAYLPMNETHGGDDPLYGVPDLTDTANYYTYSGNVWGKEFDLVYPYARDFAAPSTGYIKGGSVIIEPLNPVTSFTLIVWAKHAAAPSGYYGLVDALDDVTDGWYFSIAWANVRSTIVSGGTTYYAQRNDILNTWNHYVMRYNSSTQVLQAIRGNLPYYGQANSVPPPGSYNSYWWIGARVGGGSKMDGQIGPVIFFNDYITDTELTWMYNNGRGRTYGELLDDIDIHVHYRPEHRGV